MGLFTTSPPFCFCFYGWEYVQIKVYSSIHACVCTRYVSVRYYSNKWLSVGKGSDSSRGVFFSAPSFLHTSSTDLREKTHQQRTLETKLWWSRSELRIQTATGMFLLMPLCRQKRQYFFLWYQTQYYHKLLLNIILYETFSISDFIVIFFCTDVSNYPVYTYLLSVSCVAVFLSSHWCKNVLWDE